MKTLYLTDLDGTLLNGRQTTSPFTESVINNLVERGGLFSFATARSEETAAPAVKGIKVSAPPIFYNGAVIGYAERGAPPTRIFFSDNIGLLIRELVDTGIYPIVYSFIDGEEKFSFVKDKCTDQAAAFLETRQHCRRYRAVNSFEELIQGKIYYLTFIGSGKKLSPYYEKYRSCYNCIFQKDTYTDSKVKDALWEKWGEFLGRHFPDGGKDDPEYCVIHFTANETTVYIDGAFETFEI